VEEGGGVRVCCVFQFKGWAVAVEVLRSRVDWGREVQGEAATLALYVLHCTAQWVGSFR
jgi:hypothetical protein